MTVFRVMVKTAWFFPGNSAGDPSHYCKPSLKTFFVQAGTIEKAIELLKSKRGCQDDVFEVSQMDRLDGDCEVVSEY